MIIRMYFAALLAFSLCSIHPINASMIDDSGPNSRIVGKAFGFMLFGNDGFMKPGIDNLAVDGCKVTYEIDGGFLLARNSKNLHKLRPE